MNVGKLGGLVAQRATVRRAVVVAAVTGAVLMSGATAAFADSCANVSRAPAACGSSCVAPVIEGNWVWLPSIDPQAPQAWGFAPPGTVDSTMFGFPGAAGNYTNGQTSSLLGVSAVCAGGAQGRQMTHGIQTGCL